VNADVIARELNIDPYRAAKIVASIRNELLRQHESFVFETVFSDPAGEKLGFLKEAERSGYTVLLCFIGTSGPAVCEERVAMRVSQGGHDVPTGKLVARYPRVLKNLRTAIRELQHVWIFDNDDLQTPFRRIAECRSGRVVDLAPPIPRWLQPLLPRPEEATSGP
jgi:predicted ABC-type ATPase